MLYRLPVAFAALLSLAAVVVATPADIGRLYGVEPRSTGRTCGSHILPEVINEREKVFASLLAEAGDRVTDVTVAAAFTVPVNFHVIYQSQNITGGYVP